MGLVYAVGPNRQDCDSDSDFLSLVHAAAENISKACTEFNATASDMGLPLIEILRVPLVSGGAFAGKCEKNDVAAALLRGIVSGAGPASPEFQFSFDGDVFRKTWIAMQI